MTAVRAKSKLEEHKELPALLSKIDQFFKEGDSKILSAIQKSLVKVEEQGQVVELLCPILFDPFNKPEKGYKNVETNCLALLETVSKQLKKTSNSLLFDLHLINVNAVIYSTNSPAILGVYLKIMLCRSDLTKRTINRHFSNNLHLKTLASLTKIHLRKDFLQIFFKYLCVAFQGKKIMLNTFLKSIEEALGLKLINREFALKVINKGFNQPIKDMHELMNAVNTEIQRRQSKLDDLKVIKVQKDKCPNRAKEIGKILFAPSETKEEPEMDSEKQRLKLLCSIQLSPIDPLLLPRPLVIDDDLQRAALPQSQSSDVAPQQVDTCFVRSDRVADSEDDLLRIRFADREIDELPEGPPATPEIKTTSTEVKLEPTATMPPTMPHSHPTRPGSVSVVISGHHNIVQMNPDPFVHATSFHHPIPAYTHSAPSTLMMGAAPSVIGYGPLLFPVPSYPVLMQYAQSVYVQTPRLNPYHGHAHHQGGAELLQAHGSLPTTHPAHRPAPMHRGHGFQPTFFVGRGAGTVPQSKPHQFSAFERRRDW